MELSCKEVLKPSCPASLLKLSTVAWINGRKDWDGDLALHLCNVSKELKKTVFDCDVINARGRLYYSYNTLEEIVNWENDFKSTPLYKPRWLFKNMKRPSMVVKLQDDIILEDDEIVYNKKYKYEN